MKALLQNFRWRWLIIGVAAALASLVGGLLYWMATAPAAAPTPQAPPTRPADSYSAPLPTTPTAEADAAMDETVRNCPGRISKALNQSGDSEWRCLGHDGLPMSKEEIGAAWENREEWDRRALERWKMQATATARDNNVKWLAFTGRDGLIDVPDDVRVRRLPPLLITCDPRKHCPQPPQYEITRKSATVWVDGFGYLYRSQGDMSDPDLFSFLDGVVEDVRPQR